jgi:hypothetical protein
VVNQLLASVFVIAAVRQYMRFLQFKISDEYLASLAAEDEMTEFIELWATQWYDLHNRGERQSAVENIVALVARQATLA